MEPTMNTTPVTETENKSHGALIGSIIIVLLLVVGATYYYISMAKENAMRNEQMENATPENDSVTASLSTQSTDDDINSIGADIESTDFNTLDSGIE